MLCNLFQKIKEERIPPKYILYDHHYPDTNTPSPQKEKTMGQYPT